MKKFLVIFCSVSFVLGCNKEISLVNPEITISPFEPAPLDTVVTTLIAEATVDGETVGLDSYVWKVFDENNQEITILSAENSEMRWSPKDEGVFFIEATVKAGNKTVTETKQVNVKHNTTSIQRYLAGNWIGIGSAAFIPNNWEAQFNIEENGHYAASVTNTNGNTHETQVFANGNDASDDPEKRFVISNINGNGFATGTVKFVHSPGTLLEYGIKDLKFSNDYQNVSFTVFWGAEITYELQRSDGSPILDGPTESIQITPDVQTDHLSENGGEQEFYFETTEAGLYSVAWFDSWFDGYDASILVSAYNNDKSKYYFQDERLIQMNGSPMPIYVSSSERVNLSVKNKGKYGIKITPLNEEDGTSLTIGTPSNVMMNLGDTQLLYFEAEANKDYEIVVGNNVDGGAYDDGTVTHLSILEEGEDSFSEYKSSIPFPCCGGTKTFSVSADSNKKIYLVIDAAYWFKANMVNIVVNEL